MGLDEEENAGLEVAPLSLEPELLPVFGRLEFLQCVVSAPTNINGGGLHRSSDKSFV